MLVPIRCRYVNEPVRLKFGQYVPNPGQSSGNTSLELFGADGSRLMVASVNVRELLPDGQIAIKTWSENLGIEAALIQAGILEAGVIRTIPTGHVSAEIYRLGPAVALGR